MSRPLPGAPDEPPSPRVTYLIKRLELAVRADMDAIVGNLGVTVPQYTALSVLARHPGMSGAQLSRRSFVSPQACSEMLAVLERKGLVRRASDAANRRVRRVLLTEDGKRLLAACDSAMDDLERRMLRDLSPRDVDHLRTSLGFCVGALALADVAGRKTSTDGTALADEPPHRSVRRAQKG